MLLLPDRVLFQNFLPHIRIPAVTIAALARNFVHGVVNGLVAIAEERTIGTDFIVTRPERSAAGNGDEMASVAVHVAESDVANRRLLEPRRAVMHRGDDFRSRRQPHQEREDARA